LFSIGLQIVHTVPTYPKFMVFWIALFWQNSRFDQLKTILESLDYEVRG